MTQIHLLREEAFPALVFTRDPQTGSVAGPIRCGGALAGQPEGPCPHPSSWRGSQPGLPKAASLAIHGQEGQGAWWEGGGWDRRLTEGWPPGLEPCWEVLPSAPGTSQSL